MKISRVSNIHGKARAYLLPLWFLVAVQWGVMPPSACAQQWKWAIQDLDLGGYGTSIISDHDGNLHLSYYMAAGGQLKYGYRAAGDSKWYTMTVDRQLNTMETGIGLDADGNPQICYTPNAAKYAHWNKGKWLVQEIDPGSGYISYLCSIRVDLDGKPRMSWYLVGKYLRYAVLQDGAWLAQSVDGGSSEPGKWNSMVLDSHGLPHIAYSDFPTGQLKYAWFDGKKWSVMLVDSPDPKNFSAGGGQRGMGSSLVLDSNGNPIISYYDESSLKVATLIAGEWRKETIAKLPPFGKWGWQSFRSTLLLDSKGLPHVGFQSWLGLEHAWSDGTAWHSQVIIPAIGEPHFENAMAMDPSGTLYITFRDPTDGTLRLATGTSAPAPQTIQTENGSVR